MTAEQTFIMFLTQCLENSQSDGLAEFSTLEWRDFARQSCSRIDEYMAHIMLLPYTKCGWISYAGKKSTWKIILSRDEIASKAAESAEAR